jgi:8-oxo-dGTP pyrophosphatase MutT (NUDIX family)
MSMANKLLIAAGDWGKNISWELHETSVLPPAELCTAVMCVAIANNKIVLARSERGWGMLGGHIEAEETLDAALFREAREEGGFLIDQYRLFAVRKITAKSQVSPRPGVQYPFPTSYIAYYWATTANNLEAPSGEEILESTSCTIEEVSALGTPDLLVIKAGWRAYLNYQLQA